MRNFIAEFFIILVIIALSLTGVVLLKNSIAGALEAIGTELEERKLNRKIRSRLSRGPSPDLRSAALEVLLWDAKAFHNWLENKSILPDTEKQMRAEECLRAISAQTATYALKLQHLSDEEVLNGIMKQISSRDPAWRREFFSRLESQSRTSS